MLRKRYLLAVTALLSFFQLKAQDPRPADVKQFLLDNIHISYIADPNQPTPDIRPISTQFISDNTDGILFGKTGNNGMDLCAEFLTELINRVGGDLKFQQTVYYALKLAGKPIDLFFVNDSRKGIEDGYLSVYNLYTAPGTGGRNMVWPATYSVTDAPGTRPAIVFGSEPNTSLLKLKEMFCGMTASLGIGNFGPARKFLFRKVTVASKGQPVNEMILAFPISDIRRVAAQALANVFSMHYSMSLRETYNEWIKSDGFVWPVKADPAGLPDEFNLRQQLIKELKKDPGGEMKKPDWKVSDEFSRDFRKYEPDLIAMDLKYGAKYRILNDVFLGMIFYQYAKNLGMNALIQAIRYKDNRFVKSPKGNKVLMMFENLCLSRLNGKTYEDLARARGTSKQGESFGIGLLDIYAFINILGEHSSLASDFSETVEAITGGMISAGEAENIIPYYVSTWQYDLQQRFKKMKKDPQTNIREMAVSELATLMGLK